MVFLILLTTDDSSTPSQLDPNRRQIQVSLMSRVFLRLAYLNLAHTISAQDKFMTCLHWRFLLRFQAQFQITRVNYWRFLVI